MQPSAEGTIEDDLQETQLTQLSNSKKASAPQPGAKLASHMSHYERPEKMCTQHLSLKQFIKCEGVGFESSRTFVVAKFEQNFLEFSREIMGPSVLA